MKSKTDHAQLERFIDALFLGIENRGTHATGFVAITKDGEFVLDKKDIEATSFVKIRKKMPVGSRIILCHTRWATQGSPKEFQNNHPVNVGTTFVTHNGHIRNDDAVFRRLEMKRNAEVDSEAIAATLYKHGFDQAEEALGYLSGGYAIAAVDPIQHPQELFLFKGPTYPLVIHDSKNWLVWASTKETIMNAWSTVLGTPPKAGFKDFSFNDALYIKDGVVEEKKLSLKYNTGGTGSTSTGHWWAGMDDEYGDDEDFYWGQGASDSYNITRSGSSPKKRAAGNHTILDQRDEIARMQESGETRVPAWEQRAEMKETIKRFHTGRWNTCPHCTRTVPEICTWTSLVYGLICEDCYNLATDKDPSTRGVVGGSTKREYMFTTKYTKEELEQLNSWATMSNWIHWAAVRRVKDETGLTVGLIDYVLFRVEKSALDQNDKLLDLYVKLHDSYWAAVEVAWEEWSEEWKREQEEAEAEEGEWVDEGGNLWITCAAGTHKVGEDCEACDAAQCGVKVFADEDDGCRLKSYCLGDSCETACPNRIAAEEKAAASKPKEHACLYPNCKKKAKVFIGLNGWCKKHYGQCSMTKCGNETRGFLSDGRRACHTHMRGQKGGTFDGDKQRIAKLAGRR